MAWVTAAIAIGSAIMATKQGHDAERATQRLGAAEQAAAEDVAKGFDFNAALADMQAIDAESRAQADADRYRAQVQTFIGSQRAGFAANGVDVNYGSAVDVQADTAALGELDALQIVNNGKREAWGFRVDANDLRRKSGIARRSGLQAVMAAGVQGQTIRANTINSILGTGTTLLQAQYGFRPSAPGNPGTSPDN